MKMQDVSEANALIDTSIWFLRNTKQEFPSSFSEHDLVFAAEVWQREMEISEMDFIDF